MNKINVVANIKAPLKMVWKCWTDPSHVINWNFASNDWHCPSAENTLSVGGEFHYIMAAKDESFSFDFWGKFVHIEEERLIEIMLGDGRKMSLMFESVGDETRVTETFDPEDTNPLELQKAGWQAILDNFKRYTEAGF